jgi:hypothetical protein
MDGDNLFNAHRLNATAEGFYQVIVVAGELLLIRFSCYVVLSPSSSRLFFDKPCATMECDWRM